MAGLRPQMAVVPWNLQVSDLGCATWAACCLPASGIVSEPARRTGLSRSRPHHSELTVRTEYAGASGTGAGADGDGSRGRRRRGEPAASCGAVTGAPCPARNSWRSVCFRNGFDQPRVGWGPTSHRLGPRDPYDPRHPVRRRRRPGRARRRCRKGQGWEARPMGMKALEKELRELRSMFGQSDGANGGECNLVP